MGVNEGGFFKEAAFFEERQFVHKFISVSFFLKALAQQFVADKFLFKHALQSRFLFFSMYLNVWSYVYCSTLAANSNPLVYFATIQTVVCV